MVAAVLEMRVNGQNLIFSKYHMQPFLVLALFLVIKEHKTHIPSQEMLAATKTWLFSMTEK